MTATESTFPRQECLKKDSGISPVIIVCQVLIVLMACVQQRSAAANGHLDECMVDTDCLPELLCTRAFSRAENYCLCEAYLRPSFWDATSRLCRPVSSLAFHIQSTSTTATSVTFTWTARTYGSEVKFEVALYDDRKQPITGSPFTVDGLTPGTKYMVTITSTLQDNGYYAKRTAYTYEQVVTKMDYKQECDSSDECREGLHCISSALQPVCLCQNDRFIWDVKGHQCRLIKDHKHSCSPDVMDECRSGLSCSGLHGGAYCLCNSFEFWDAAILLCRSQNSLAVFIDKIDTTQTSAIFFWSSNTYYQPVKYELQINGQKRAVTKSPTTVDGLSEGTLYDFEFLAYLEPDAYYPKREASIHSHLPIGYGYRRPCAGTLGCVSDLACTTYHDATHFCLCRFQHFWDAYNNSCRPLRDLAVEIVTVTTTTDSVTITWTSSEYGQDVRYEIRYNDQSLVVTGSPTTLSGLDIGTAYTFYFLVYLEPDAYHPRREYTTVQEVSTRMDHGQPCTGQRIDECRPGLTCDSNSVCTCNPGSSWDAHSGRCYLDFSCIPAINVTPGRDDETFQVFLNVHLVLDGCTKHMNFSFLLTDVKTHLVVTTKHLVGYSSTNVIFPDLKAYHRYRVAAFAETEVGASPDTIQSGVVRTLVSKPGTARNVMVHPDGFVATKFTLTLDCPPEEDRNGTILRARITKASLGDLGLETFTFHMPSDCFLEVLSEQLSSFKASRNYSFSVTVENEEFESQSSQPIFYYILPKPPLFSRHDHLIQPSSSTDVTDTSIRVQVCASCLTDDSQGEIVLVGLIICVQVDENTCEQSAGKKTSTENADHWRSYPTWAQAAACGFIIPYRATPTNWLLNNLSNDFIIGLDVNCPKDPNTTLHCNGPLPSGKEVLVVIVGCTDGGCTKSQAFAYKTKAYNNTGCDENIEENGEALEDSEADGDKVTTKDSMMINGLAIGGAVILLGTAVIVIFIIRRRRKKNPSDEMPTKTVSSSGKESRPIPISNFRSRVAQLHEDSNLLFENEFEDIKNLSVHVASNTRENHNAFHQIKEKHDAGLSQNQSRAALRTSCKDHRDSIITTAIRGLNSQQDYVMVQRPSQDNAPLFWTMVWELKCSVIVVLADHPKVRHLGRYWPQQPNKPVDCGGIGVEMIGFTQIKKSIMRSFQLTYGRQTLRVSHFSISRWWDAGLDLSYKDSVDFINLVRREASCPNAGPMVVHGGQGVDWSGTFIALDYFIQSIDQHGLGASLDVFGHVLDMQRTRPRVVQAENQYIFIHDVLCEVIDTKFNAREDRPYETSFTSSRTADDNIYAMPTMEEDVYCNDVSDGEHDHGAMDGP